MLVGNIVAFVSGGFYSITVSWATNFRMTQEQAEAEWDKTRDIDNPLSPWVTVYKVIMRLGFGVLSI